MSRSDNKQFYVTFQKFHFHMKINELIIAKSDDFKILLSDI